MRQPYDKSSKWLIEHHADSILRLGGLQDVESWQALHSDLIQPRKLPDGLVEVMLRGNPDPHLFLLEICTYPENRMSNELLEDLAMVFLNRGILPEVLTLVLHPKGRVRVRSSVRMTSPAGWTRWSAGWRVIELWKLPAAPLLSLDDPGVVPWVPLTQSVVPPATVLQQCRSIIDRKAAPDEHESLLVVTQVLAGLRYNDPKLLQILGGRDAMIESPVLQELIAEVEAKTQQKTVLMFLKRRFGEVPDDLAATVRGVFDKDRLDDLTNAAAACQNLQEFASALRE